eukprot:231849_1
MSAFLSMMTLHIQLMLCTQYKNGDVSSPFTFYLDDHILSHSGLVQLVMQLGDGNLVMQKYVYASFSWSYGGWATGTDPNGDHVELQEDGGLVVFDATGGVLWQSNSIAGTAPFRLIVTDDVETYILDSLDKIVWSTNPSFASFEAVWTESFNSKSWMGWDLVGDIIFPSASIYCPNHPDECLKTTASDIMGWARITTDISMYNSVQLQVDIAGHDLETGSDFDDACQIWWSFDAPSYESDWQWYTLYPTGVYKDVIIDFPLPSSYTSIAIDLTVLGNSNSAQCLYDNAILRGILTRHTFWIHWIRSFGPPIHHSRVLKQFGLSHSTPTQSPTKTQSPTPFTADPTQPTHTPTSLPSTKP